MIIDMMHRCLECDALATQWLELATGRVMWNGVDYGQAAHLCDEHKVGTMVGSRLSQPQNTEQVWFRWPGDVETKEQAIGEVG